MKQNNIIFTHDTINGKTPPIFENYFIFNKTIHQHQTVNSLNSIYSLPTGSIKLPAYRTESGKSSIRFICCDIWNSTLKDLSMKYIDNYNKDPFWINKTNVKTLKHILQKHFLECYWTQISYYWSMTLFFSFFIFCHLGMNLKKWPTLWQLLLNTFR